jgi:tripartite-type tricarboxylate transporter receptor subunit TctC
MQTISMRSLIGSLAAFAFLACGAVAAEDYPAREIHSIVNFPPGTGMDIMIRYYSVKLGELAGKPVIVENRPGATGNIATEYVVRSKPDGYTIMLTPASSTLASAAALFKKLPFDPIKDVQPVVLVSKLGFVFVVDAKSPAHTMSELTALLKSKPGHGAYGTGSNTGIVTSEMYKVRAGLTTNQVLYKGAYENFNDMYGGQLDFSSFDPTAIAEPIRAGKLRALAVTSASRLGSLPDVPTMQEAGFPDYDLTPWIGLIVPTGTPQPIIDKLAAWHRQINESDETKKMLLQFGMDPLNGDAAAMSARLKADVENWAALVKLAKIEPQ